MKKPPLMIRIRHLAMLFAASILGDVIVVAFGVQPWNIMEYEVKNLVIVFLCAVAWSLASKYGLLSPKEAIRQPRSSAAENDATTDPVADPMSAALKRPPGWDIYKLIEHDPSVTVIQREDPLTSEKPPPGYQ